MKPMNQAWNRSGSSSRNTRLNVSWLGTPCSSLRNSCKNSSFDRPNSAMSAQVSPPLSSVQNPITRISCSSCRFAFPVRGSSKSSKISSNSSMAPHPPLSVPFGRILPTPPAQYIFSNAIPLGLAVNRGYSEEIGRFQAGAPDQGPVHIGNCQQLLGIGRLDRAAIEDADVAAFGAEPRLQPLADEGMRLGHVGRCRGQSGADRPDRLVREHQIGARTAIGQRAIELAADHRQGLPALALGALFADANNREQTRAACGHGLGAHLGVGFMMVGAAFGMPDNHRHGTGVLEHFGGDIAGMGAGRLRMAILPADGNG